MRPSKSPSGKVLAYENDVSEYRKEMRSRSNGLLGYFNPKEGPEGKTHDATGRVIGRGGQRGKFIQRDG